MRLKLLSASILIASVLLLSAARSVDAQPSPGAIPQSHREAAPEEKPSADRATEPYQQRATPNALALPKPSGTTRDSRSADSTSYPTEEERHDRKEETLEHQLVCLTAVLAVIEVITLGVFIFTMLANIKAAYAASEATKIATKGQELAYRAYVNIENATVKDWTEAKGPVVSYELRNTGKVPATGVVQVVAVSKADGSHPDPRYVQKGWVGAADRTLIDRVLAPGETIVQSHWLREVDKAARGNIPPSITDADLVAALEGRRFIMISIQVGYWDGFETKQSRQTSRYFNYICGRVEDWGGRQE